MTALEKLLAHAFKNKDLLKQALTHASISENKNSYERLEFLGDRILSFVIADMLFAAFPKDKEGALAKRHSMLVKQGALEQVAHNLDLPNHMHYAKRDKEQAPSPSMQADVVEALIAALYLDGGFAAAEKFIRTHWQDLIHTLQAPPEDAKSALQEWAQAKGLELPKYEVTGRKGPDHNPTFIVEVTLDGYPPQQAESTSKQAAQKIAAKSLLDYLRANI